ncbi:DsbA family protein [Aggregatibacter kilianii]|uniref:DsbA family protein n=1 Tax=Aggregatibacter kilianii TaxID=2025884 RepID=UPI000D655ECA|nr:DsbA family protein [Aggregatibacter kilianii]
MNRLKISIFTDPMMGLSYESEPFFRKLETHFGDQIEVQPMMSGLVRNVYDFVNPNDLAVSEDYAIERYLPRLAAIYNAEQAISGMPIAMEKLDLFSTERTSSVPLNLAYKAVERIAPEKAEAFLYRLRFATIAEVRPTTKLDELARVAEQVGVNQTDFLTAYHAPETEAALAEDFRRREQLRLFSLPAYLFEYKGQTVLAKGVLNDKALFELVEKITNGELKSTPPEATSENLRKLFERHPLINLIELRYVFDLTDGNAVLELVKPLLENGEIRRIDMAGGVFFEVVV